MKSTALRLFSLAAARERLTELDGGYVNTTAGVRRERGVLAHVDRNAGAYAGTGLLGRHGNKKAAALGYLVGSFVDNRRRRGNATRTTLEPVAPNRVGKGPRVVLSALTPGMIAFGAHAQAIARYRRAAR